jgi:hypothetical protein
MKRENIKVLLILALALGTASVTQAAVKLVRAPDEGIQPQSALDEKGAPHLIYLKGDTKSGELFYTRLLDNDTFAPSIPVNSSNGPIAIGNIRGAQLAVGKGGRVHVAWMGNGKTMYYTRLNDSGTGFEPPRNLVQWAGGLDGGGTVTADEKGNVYVAWNGRAPGNKADESGRAIFIARSNDEGKSFSREEQAKGSQAGVCACCGMRASTDSRGNLYLLYRATDGESRDMTLLASVNGGKNFKSAVISKWAINGCPMSSSTMAEVSGGILVATEKAGQVSVAQVAPDSLLPSDVASAPGMGKRKHPVVAVNSKGETLLAWTENMGWAKGGSLAWQLYDVNHKPVGEKGRAAGVPTWSLITGFAKANGDFVIVY